MLSDNAIKRAMGLNQIVIEPFDKRQLGANSYDVRLGDWYYTEKENNVDIYLLENLTDLWDGPFQSDGNILIPSGQTVLAHTQEIIGSTSGITTKMAARSTIVRSGMCVCKAGGFGDVGYINRWTMEISNFTKHNIYLPVGMRVAQIAFYEVDEYHATEYTGKYGQGDWKAEDMIPHPEKDWEVIGGNTVSNLDLILPEDSTYEMWKQSYFNDNMKGKA